MPRTLRRPTPVLYASFTGGKAMATGTTSSLVTTKNVIVCPKPLTNDTLHYRMVPKGGLAP